MFSTPGPVAMAGPGGSNVEGFDMAWKMVDCKVRTCTRSLAEEFATMEPAPHDRRFNVNRADRIKTEISRGTFRTCEWARAHCKETGKSYRVNGKHGSTILAGMNGDFPKDLRVVIEEFNCDTLEDVASLYSTFDSYISVRSSSDINQVYAAACGNLDDVNRRQIDAAVAGIAYSIWHDSMHSHTREERASLILDHSEFVLWYDGIIAGRDTSKTTHLRRSAVVGAMVKTWQKSRKASTEFWTSVRDETGTTPDCPDRKLAKFLTSARLSSRGVRVAKSELGGRREMFAKSITAWNAWREGKSTELKYFPNAKLPDAK